MNSEEFIKELEEMIEDLQDIIEDEKKGRTTLGIATEVLQVAIDMQNAANEYAGSHNIDLHNMQCNKCCECERETISDLAEAQIELDKVKRYNKLLEKCLDVKEELSKVLREDNEELRNKLEIYKK